MYNRNELERVNAVSQPSPAQRSFSRAAAIYSASPQQKIQPPPRTPQAQFGMQSSFNPLGAVSADAADEKVKKIPGPSAPPNVKNPFLHHVSEQKHSSYNAPHYIPPHKRHLLRQYLKRSIASDEKVSVNLAAARAGLSLDDFPNNFSLNQPNGNNQIGHNRHYSYDQIGGGRFGGASQPNYLLFQQTAPIDNNNNNNIMTTQSSTHPNRLIRMERSTLPPHLRRQFDALNKATAAIKDRHHNATFHLKSQATEQAKLALYNSTKNQFETQSGPPARNLKQDLNFQRHNFKLGYGAGRDLKINGPGAMGGNQISQGNTINSDIANLKDFQGMTATTPLRNRSFSPSSRSGEAFLRSPMLLGGKLQATGLANKDINYKFSIPPPFQSTKQNMKNVKNQSSLIISQSANPKTISNNSEFQSQNKMTFVNHQGFEPLKAPPPGLSFQSNVGKNFNQVRSPYEDKKSNTPRYVVTDKFFDQNDIRSPTGHQKSKSMFMRPATGQSFYSNGFSSGTASNRLWENYKNLDKQAPLTGPGSPEFTKIKDQHSNAHFRFGATYQIQPNDKSFKQAMSHAQYTGLNDSKELKQSDQVKRRAIVNFMKRRHLPLGGTTGGPPTTIQGDEYDKEAQRQKLAGKKVPQAEPDKESHIRDADGKVIGEKVMGSNLPIDQIKWMEAAPPVVGVDSSYYYQKQNSDIGWQKAHNKAYRAAEMAHYHRLGLHRQPMNSEKQVKFSGAVPTKYQQDFTRIANKQHIEKQHFQFNKSFDIKNQTNSKDFRSVHSTLDTYERATGISSSNNNPQRRLSRSESVNSPIGIAGRIAPAGGNVNQDGRPNRVAFVKLLDQIKNQAGTVRPFTGASSFGGGDGTSAPGAQFRSNFKLGTQGNNYLNSITNNYSSRYQNGGDASMINRSSPGIFQGVNLKANLNQTQPIIGSAQSPTLNLQEIKEENDRRLKNISTNGWNSHFKMGNDKEHLARQKGRSMYGKFFVWRQPVVDV